MKNVLLAILFAVICFAFTGCGAFVSDSDVVRAVETQGYTNVSIQDSHIFFVSWRGCSKSDDAVYELLVTNPIGKRVNILACAGWPFKGVTIRTE